ncbi:fructokinase ScrK [Xylocopilactobacillus apicola]|uniref:Fructokinase n=1 Tax=Xylocopilactobacillus apicola TaxID=2932184 RepID=A0AAU9DVW9_9LACO|nr:fructokinase ScrK [Xylocopilactobacillus apicola]BDR58068.1 fructokinase [Xylocopilactobacillus apicola]
MQYGSVEAGGTKFVCAIGNDDYQIKDQIQFPTTTPKETIQRVIDYFSQFQIDALGIASFGPIETRRNSPQYGYITTTPKKGWQNTNFVGLIKSGLKMPISWTTDVNSAAFGEYVMTTLFNEQISSVVYYTIGTGVGAGVVVDGKFVGSLGHLEMGHVLVKRHPADLDFLGICPYHKDCLEGLVSGPTFEARLGNSGKDVPFTNPVWDILAYYVAQAAMDTTLSFRPDKIVFGGGVTSENFLNKVRQEFSALLNDYLPTPKLEHYISLPAVKDNGSATVGNFFLAARLLKE